MAKPLDPGGLTLRLWTFHAGVLGIAAFVALLGFYALADPGAGGVNRWSWLGTANDALSLAFTLPCAVMAALVWRRLRSLLLAVLTALLFFALGAFAWTTAQLLAGAIDFEVQVVIAAPLVVALFAWTLVASRTGSRRDRLDVGMSRWGVTMSIAAIAGVGLFGFGLLLTGPVQTAVFIAGGVPAGISWFVFPFWCAVLAYRWRSPVSDPRST